MVAIVDMEAGRAERERMVTLALEHGWIQKCAAWAAERMDGGDCVTLLVAYNATPPGGLGILAAEALSHWRGPGNQKTKRVQKAAGLPSYVVFPVPLAIVSELVDEGTAGDLRHYVARDQYAVLCMNADREVLIAGVSPDRKEG